MKLLPFHFQDGRVHGARAARAAISRRLSVPISDNSAISVRAITPPTAGTEENKLAFARRAGEALIVSSTSPSTLSISRLNALSRRAMLFGPAPALAACGHAFAWQRRLYQRSRADVSTSASTLRKPCT